MSLNLNLKKGEYVYSASQIDTFRDCKRKWALDKIDKVPRGQNKYAALGSAIHDVLENYLKTGEWPMPGEVLAEIEGREYFGDELAAIALPGVPYLPEPGVADVEGQFLMDLPGLGVMIGYIDAEFVEDGVPVNIDHKTTSDLRWAMTEEQLKENTQSVIYAVHTLEKHGVDVIKNRWVYYQRNPKRTRAKEVEAEMHLTEVAKHWEGVLEYVQEMKQLRDSGVKGAEVEYNAGACDKYGGCPYKGTACSLTGMERLRSFAMNQAMKDRIKNRKQGKADAPPPPPPAQEAEVAVNPPEKGSNPLKNLKNSVKPNVSNPPAVVQPADAPVDNFEISLGKTINVAQYESVRLDVKLSGSGDMATVEQVHEWLKDFVGRAESEIRGK